MLAVPKATRPPAPTSANDTSQSEASAAVAAVAAIDINTLNLKVPIRTHAGMVSVLKIREPNASDYIEVGRLPFDVRGDETDRRATIDFKVASAWAVRLTDVDAITVGQLSGPDWMGLVSRINALLMQTGIDSLGN